MAVEFFELGHDAFFGKHMPPLGVPISDLREVLLAKVFVEDFHITAVGWEEGEKVLDVSTLQGSSEMIHGLLCQVGTEDDGQHRCRCVWETFNVG